MYRVLHGHVLTALRSLESESVSLCVTSPPYHGLRSYSTEPQVWGGDAGHAHVFGQDQKRQKGGVTEGETPETIGRDLSARRNAQVLNIGAFCPCGAWRGELGSEPTVERFISNLVAVFAEVKRVLRPDGLVFCNLGDSYAGSGRGPTGHNGIGDQGTRQGFVGTKRGPNSQFHDRSVKDFQRPAGAVPGLKPKDLMLIPERFALAMQDAGWWVRSRIAWCKKSAMPESVSDRPTSAWEHIWMFSKSATYFYDAQAVRERVGEPVRRAATFRNGGVYTNNRSFDNSNPDTSKDSCGDGEPTLDGANLRNFWLAPDGVALNQWWLLGPDPLKEQHYAAFPREIPRRAILAGTSAYGCCAVESCGAPWKRTVERGTAPAVAMATPKGAGRDAQGLRTPERLGHGPGWRQQPYVAAATTGWAPTCAHTEAGVVPATVLDPFAGSGTTLQVAEELGRDSIGVELNPSYVALIEKRMAGVTPSLPGMAV